MIDIIEKIFDMSILILIELQMSPYLTHHHAIYYMKIPLQLPPSPINHTPHPPCRQCPNHYRPYFCLRTPLSGSVFEGSEPP